MGLMPKKIPGLWGKAKLHSWRGSLYISQLFKDCPKCLSTKILIKTDKLGWGQSKLGFLRTKRLLSQAARYDQISLPQVKTQITKGIDDFLDARENHINVFYLTTKEVQSNKTQLASVLAFAKKYGFKKQAARCEALLRKVTELEQSGLQWERGDLTITLKDLPSANRPPGVEYVAGISRFTQEEARALFTVPLDGIHSFRKPDFEGPWHYQSQRMSVLESLEVWAGREGPLKVKFERNPKYPSHIQIIILKDNTETLFIDFSLRKALNQVSRELT